MLPSRHNTRRPTTPRVPRPKSDHRGAKSALGPLQGDERTQALQLFFEACVRLNKKRMMGDLVRGDSAFIIACRKRPSISSSVP